MKLKITLTLCALTLAAGSALAAQSPRKVTCNDLEGVSSDPGKVLLNRVFVAIAKRF